MRPDGRTTSTRLHAPTLLAVACGHRLLVRCRVAAVPSGILVKGCALDEAPTQAAERRPLAILLPVAVYTLDCAEIDALARDVRAVVVTVDEDVHELELEAMIAGAIQTCLAKRERDVERGEAGPASARRGPPSSAGRYAIHEGTRSETPFGTRSETPFGTRAPVPPKPVRPAPPSTPRPHFPAPPVDPSPRSGVRTRRIHCELESLFEDPVGVLAR